MMMDCKRKPESEEQTDGSDKKRKMIEDNKVSGKFGEDKIPKDVFPLGDSVFLMTNEFRGNVAIHIRRYKKYGKTFYPTSEGITLRPWWIDYIADRRTLPTMESDLKGSIFLPPDEIKITSADFMNFTFTRFHQQKDGCVFSKSITITKDQWSEMIKQFREIKLYVLDHMYRAMDLLKAYKDIAEEPIPETMPECLDTSLGKEYLLQHLRNCLCDLVKESGGLKDPEVVDCGELWGNRVESFDAIASGLVIEDIANPFYHRLFERQNFLSLLPIAYVTQDFFKNLRLDHVLREARKVLCPPGVYIYYEDVANYETNF